MQGAASPGTRVLGSDQAVAMPLVEEDAREATLSAALDDFSVAVGDSGAIDASDLGPFPSEVVEAGSRLLQVMGSCQSDDAAVLRSLRSTLGIRVVLALQSVQEPPFSGCIATGLRRMICGRKLTASFTKASLCCAGHLSGTTIVAALLAIMQKATDVTVTTTTVSGKCGVCDKRSDSSPVLICACGAFSHVDCLDRSVEALIDSGATAACLACVAARPLVTLMAAGAITNGKQPVVLLPVKLPVVDGTSGESAEPNVVLAQFVFNLKTSVQRGEQLDIFVLAVSDHSTSVLGSPGSSRGLPSLRPSEISPAPRSRLVLTEVDDSDDEEDVVDLGSRRPVPLSARPTRLDALLDTVARTAEQTRYEDLAKSNVELTAQVQTLATTMSAFMLDKSTLLPVPAAMGAPLPVVGPLRDAPRGRRLRHEEHSGHFGEAWKDRIPIDTIFATGLFAVQEGYHTLGMNDAAPYGNDNVKSFGEKRADQATGRSTLLGSSSRGKTLTLVAGALVTQSGAPLTPKREVTTGHLAFRVGHVRAACLAAVGPFNPSHQDFVAHKDEMSLVLGRYAVVGAFITFLSMVHSLEWPVVFRYLVYLVETFTIHRSYISRLDQEYTDLGQLEGFELDVAAELYVRENLNQAWLVLAKSEAMPISSKAISQAPRLRCSLCGSHEHAMDEHDGPITIPCTFQLVDGKPCGKKHKRTGVNSTECRVPPWRAQGAPKA